MKKTKPQFIGIFCIYLLGWTRIEIMESKKLSDKQVIEKFNDLTEAMIVIRGDDRSARSRAISICITLTEQAVAYWAIYVGGNIVKIVESKEEVESK